MISKYDITIGDKNYTLEFDRRHILIAEQNYGLNILQFDSQIINQAYAIWNAAMHKNHNNISVEKRMDLFDEYNIQTEGGAMELVGDLMVDVGNFFSPTQPKKKKEKK